LARLAVCCCVARVLEAEHIKQPLCHRAGARWAGLFGRSRGFAAGNIYACWQDCTCVVVAARNTSTAIAVGHGSCE
jgi:hypothetical protein